MRAALFFAMLRHGRRVERRRQSRDYFELAKVTAYPHLTPQAQEELLACYYEGSLSTKDHEVRDEFIRDTEARARQEEVYVRPVDVFDFFKTTTQRATHG